MTVSVNVVVLAGTVAADPVERTMPGGKTVTELRLSVPEAGRLPLPVSVDHSEVGAESRAGLTKNSEVIVYGTLERRFFRSGAGARSLTEVRALGVKVLPGGEGGRDGEEEA